MGVQTFDKESSFNRPNIELFPAKNKMLTISEIILKSSFLHQFVFLDIEKPNEIKLEFLRFCSQHKLYIRVDMAIQVGGEKEEPFGFKI